MPECRPHEGSFPGRPRTDLRNPLGAIMMSATVMMTKEGPDGTLANGRSDPEQRTRMDQLIGDLSGLHPARVGDGIPITRSRSELESRVA